MRGAASWWPWVHAGGVWLLVLLLGNCPVFAHRPRPPVADRLGHRVMLVAGSAMLMDLTKRSWFEAEPATPALAAGPLRALLPVARGAPLAIALASARWWSPWFPAASAPAALRAAAQPDRPAVALALAVSTLWLLRLRASSCRAAVGPGPVPLAVLAGIAFIAVNTSGCAWHTTTAGAWNAHSLFAPSWCRPASRSCGPCSPWR
jgi:hypothetical protein